MEDTAITRSIDIHYAHRVPQHGGKCARLHGHRGTIEVTVVGGLQPDGEGTDMVLDFGEIEASLLWVKALLCHRTILFKDDPFLQTVTQDGWQRMLPGAPKKEFEILETEFATFVMLPYAPTAERLAQLCFTLLGRRINGHGTNVRSVRFWETSKSVAQFPANPLF